MLVDAIFSGSLYDNKTVGSGKCMQIGSKTAPNESRKSSMMPKFWKEISINPQFKHYCYDLKVLASLLNSKSDQ